MRVVFRQQSEYDTKCLQMSCGGAIQLTDLAS